MKNVSKLRAAAAGALAALFAGSVQAQVQSDEGRLRVDWEKPAYVLNVRATAASSAQARVEKRRDLDDDGPEERLNCFSAVRFELGTLSASRSDGAQVLAQPLELVLMHTDVLVDPRASCPEYDFSGDLKSKLDVDRLRSDAGGYGMLETYFQFTFAFRKGTVWIDGADVRGSGLAVSRSGDGYILTGFDLSRVGLQAESLGDPWTDAHLIHEHPIPLLSMEQKRQAEASQALKRYEALAEGWRR